MVRVLCVEDEPVLGEVLSRLLVQQGWEAELVESAEGALELLYSNDCELALVDWRLPGMSGIDLCLRLRTAKIATAIIMMSSYATPQDRALALDAGADDYLVKPFDLDELFARIRAVLRRHSTTGAAHQSEAVLSYGHIRIHIGQGIATVDGFQASLTPMEEKFLVRLVRAQGGLVTNEELWKDFRVRTPPQLANIRSHMAVLRKKLSEHGAPIRTERGRGYALDMP